MQRQGRSLGRKRPTLPGTSRTPFWLIVCVVSVLLQAAFVVLVYFVADLQWYWLALAAAALPLVLTLLVAGVSSRAKFLRDLLQQDPRVIVTDPVCMRRLREVRWYGVKEFDELQRAVLQTYLAYGEDSKEISGFSAKAAFGEAFAAVPSDKGRPEGDSFRDNESFYSAESADEVDNYVLEDLRRAQRKRFWGSVASRRSEKGGAMSDDDFRSVASSADGRGPMRGRHATDYSDTRVSSLSPTRLNESTPLLADPARGVQQLPDPPRQAAANAVIAAVPGFPGPTEDPLNDNYLPWERVFKGVTDPGSSIFLMLLKQVRPGQTLTTITLPFHILEPRSMIERISDVFIHSEFLLPLSVGPTVSDSLPQDFVDAAWKASYFTRDEMATNPYWKIVSLFRWFISAYRLKPEGAKKPYNSILGEVFYCAFHKDDPCCEVRYLAEQVSHHPPVSAFFAEGAGVRAQATYYPKSKLVSPNCAAGFGEGSIELTIKVTGERFTLTWPSTYASGFISGNTRMELGGTVSVLDHQSKASLRVEFLRKGWLSGTYDTIKGAVFDAEGKKTNHTVVGVWHSITSYDDGSGRGARVLFDPQQHIPRRPTALPLDHPKLSRFVWRHLTAALRANDPEHAASAKHEVEQAQRAERKRLAEEHRSHLPLYFAFHERGPKKKSEGLHLCENWEFKPSDVTAMLP